MDRHRLPPVRRARPAPGRRSGSVLVAVLAIILLLSVLVTRFMEEAVDDLEYRAIFDEPPDVRSFAYSMLEVALAVVQEIALIDEGQLYAAEQGWGDPLGYAGIEPPDGWEVEISVRDESGRIPLNAAGEDLLNDLLEELGFDFGESRELSGALLDWIDEDNSRRLNGAESEDYLDRNPPYRAANGPLQSLEELRLLEGWDEAFFDENGRPNALFAELAGMVSVRHAGLVNLNAAPARVITLLAERDGWPETYLFDGLDEPFLREAPAGVDNAVAGARAGLLGVTVTVRRGRVPFILDALVEPAFEAGGGARVGGGGRGGESEARTGNSDEQAAMNYPFRILSLNEYERPLPPPEPGRYSAVDISR